MRLYANTYVSAMSSEFTLHIYSITDSEDEDTQDLRKCIIEFLEESDAKVLSFPPSLTGNERKIVHEVTNTIRSTSCYDYLQWSVCPIIEIQYGQGRS